MLIEFAFAIPVLIATLYYMYDAPKYKQTQSRTELAAHCLVNILQNVSQKRSDKKITLQDIGNAMAVACLAVYPGTTMYSTTTTPPYRHYYGHSPMIYLYAIKGEPGGKASVVWNIQVGSHIGCTNPTNFHYEFYGDPEVVNSAQHTAPSEIYPGLTVDDGEIKMILQYGLCYNKNAMYGFPDGRSCEEVNAQKAFGFHMLRFKESGVYFEQIIVFSPNPEIFNEIPPE